MSSPKFYRPETIEKRADKILARYELKAGSKLRLPVPVERIAEDLFDIQLLWHPFVEEGNNTILAGLAPSNRMVVFNEDHKDIFDKTPGLYRTALAHELGHWDLHVDKATLNQSTMPGIEQDIQFLYYSESKSWDERNAHLFMNHLLVPEAFLNPMIRDIQQFEWPFLYRLRDVFQVTISVIKIRLERKGLLYVDKVGNIFRSQAEFNGQKRLI